jgi:hypothetical protein
VSVFSADCEVDTTLAYCLEFRHAQHIVGIDVLQLLLLRVLRLASRDVLLKRWCCHCHDVPEKVAGKVAFYLCAILEGDLLAHYHSRAVFAAAGYCQTWPKEKERDAVSCIECAYLGENAEWRIIYYHAIVGIVGVFVVATRIERAQNHFASQVIDGTDVFDHSLENVLWCKTVVCSLRRICKLCDKRLIVMKDNRIAATTVFAFWLWRAWDIFISK